MLTFATIILTLFYVTHYFPPHGVSCVRYTTRQMHCETTRNTEIPVLWVEVDPEGQWIKSIELEQSDSTWQYVLKHERNAVTQIKVR